MTWGGKEATHISHLHIVWEYYTKGVSEDIGNLLEISLLYSTFLTCFTKFKMNPEKSERLEIFI